MVTIMIKEEIILLTMLLKICIIYDSNWKRIKNPTQIVITLLMNSMCGKTIIKPVETDTIVKDDKDDFGNIHLITIITLIQ